MNDYARNVWIGFKRVRCEHKKPSPGAPFLGLRSGQARVSRFLASHVGDFELG